ncbi:MAG: hypothetical protein NXI01_03105 [Gammaproteobacteria bacterium]|nr:hypothetical protein [Gammaproteobacteria bacterium]
MQKKNELIQVKQYFATHPNSVKYDRKKSGLASSYIRDSEGTIIRLENKADPDYVLGIGGYGRVKKTSSDQETATKIQTYPLDQDEFVREDIEQEAKINLDTGLAVGPLVTRIDEEKGIVKFYQEMHKMEESLQSRIPKLNKQQKMRAASDYLLLMSHLHEGISANSNTPYIQGDPATKNAMYDQNGNMRLIDFGLSQPLEYVDQIANENKPVVQALYFSEDDGTFSPIFDDELFQSFPAYLQNLLRWENVNEHEVRPENLITFINATLIAYQHNPDLSSADVEQLKTNPPQQTLWIEQHKREQKILKIPDRNAQKALAKMTKKLEHYQNFFADQLLRESYDETNPKYKLLVAKKHAIDTMLTIPSDLSAQEALVRIDGALMTHQALLSQPVPAMRTKFMVGLKARVRRVGSEVAIDTLQKEIDVYLEEQSSAYRAALEEFRAQAGTPSSDISSSVDDDEDRSKSPPNSL